MRIIGGKYKGRTINAVKVKGKNLRPTTGQTREALFNILSHGQFAANGGVLVDAKVLDLYCGSGALAIEALSRGANHVTCVDIDKVHLDLARQNIKDLGEEENATFIRADSSSPPSYGTRCDLIFIDPPYNKDLAGVTLNNLIKSEWLSKDAVIVVETAKREDIPLPENVTLLVDRNYGNSRIRILKMNL